jgi:hypothetical protein
MEQLAIITSIVTIAVYLTIIVKKFGIQMSWSQSYYKLKRKSLFTFVMFLTGFPIVFLGAYQEIKLPEIALMLSGISLMLVGIAPAFRFNKFEGTIHNICAFGAVAFGYIAGLLYNIEYLFIVFIAAIACYILMKKSVKNYTWYAETIAYVTNMVWIVDRFL